MFGHRRLDPADSGFRRFERTLLIGLPAIVLLVPSLWGVAAWTAADFERQRGVVFLDAGRQNSAVPHLERAVSLQPGDALAHYHLGVALFFSAEVGSNGRTPHQAYTRAAILQPWDMRFAARAIETQEVEVIQTPAGPIPVFGDRLQRVQRLLRHDPDHLAMNLLFADLSVLSNEFEPAIAQLRLLIENTADRDAIAAAYLRIGRIYADNLDSPAEALVEYERAAQFARPGSTTANQAAQRLLEGRRPPQEDGDHEGHDH